MSFFEKKIEDSKRLISAVQEEVKQPKCFVTFSVDSVGAISARAFGEKSFASVSLCYNDDTSKNNNAYMLRFATPDIDKIKSAYSVDSGIAIEEIKTNSEDFIQWVNELLSLPDNEQWEKTHAMWTHGEFKTYETKEEALKALLSGQAIELNAEKEYEDDHEITL